MYNVNPVNYTVIYSSKLRKAGMPAFLSQLFMNEYVPLKQQSELSSCGLFHFNLLYYFCCKN